jgi:hypothetical protein
MIFIWIQLQQPSRDSWDRKVVVNRRHSPPLLHLKVMQATASLIRIGGVERPDPRSNGLIFQHGHIGQCNVCWRMIRVRRSRFQRQSGQSIVKVSG